MEHFKFKITFVRDGVVTVEAICCFVTILLPLVFLPPFTAGEVSGDSDVVVSRFAKDASFVRFFFAETGSVLLGQFCSEVTSVGHNEVQGFSE
jgi:hypothetical protein